MSMPPISPGEMQLLLSRAGLVLNPGQVADLVLAWRQVAGLIASIPHDRPLADDAAYVFRLPLPVAATPARPAAPAKPDAPVPEKVVARPKPQVKPGSRPKAKTAAPNRAAKAKAKPKPKAKPPAAARRRVAKPAARKAARRRR